MPGVHKRPNSSSSMKLWSGRDCPAACQDAPHRVVSQAVRRSDEGDVAHGNHVSSVRGRVSSRKCAQRRIEP